MPNQSFTDPVLYGRPRPCRTKSESQASTSQLRQQTGSKARTGRSLDQAVPGQSQDTHQTKRRQGKRRALPRQPTGANSRHNSASRQAPRQTQGARQTKQRQGTRRTPTGTSNAEASSRRANPSDQAPPDQAAQGIQTEIASLNGDRRFQLQRSGTISSGPLKKLRVSCVHERDGKQVPCVRSLCSYARESRAC